MGVCSPGGSFVVLIGSSAMVSNSVFSSSCASGS